MTHPCDLHVAPSVVCKLHLNMDVSVLGMHSSPVMQPYSGHLGGESWEHSSPSFSALAGFSRGGSRGRPTAQNDANPHLPWVGLSPNM